MMGSPCDWESVDRFKSLADYEQLLAKITEQVANGRARVVAVDPDKGWGTAWDEHWYQCTDKNEIWRLVAPDPPFRGIFKKVGP